MRFVFLSIILLSAGAFSDQITLQNSFETNYNLLQQKIEGLKAKGEKVTDQSRQEMENLMVQMNHNHAELKKELERKNQQLSQQVDQGVRTGQDWSKRISSAYQDLSDGFTKAWAKLKTGAD
jgi:ribosomal protein L9